MKNLYLDLTNYNPMKKFNGWLISLLLLTTCTSPMKEQQENIDHIILGINDLEKGMAEFESLTGVKPVVGGIHPNSFSQNALVALDNNVYIEIMAPRPGAENIPAEFLSLDKLTPIDWAVRTQHLNPTREKLRAAGFTLSENKPGSRKKPDGSVLSWTTLGINDEGLFPFFIEWGTGTVHPSVSSPSSGTLQSFHIVTADPASIQKLVQVLQLQATVSSGKETQLQLTINTPRGKVTF